MEIEGEIAYCGGGSLELWSDLVAHRGRSGGSVVGDE